MFLASRTDAEVFGSFGGGCATAVGDVHGWEG
jgi:hypothetical protein